MAKNISRKAIINAIITNPETFAALRSALDLNDDEGYTALDNALSKWQTALNKASKSNGANKNDEIIVNEVVPFVLNSETPVTAKMVNDAIIHAERTNKASSMLRRGIELGMISRDRVRKNASYEYAAPSFDWDAYISEYDEKVAAKAANRIARAHANRS